MRTKMSNILWGIAFIVVGIGFAGNALELWDFRLFFAGWWTLFIIVPCCISLVQNGPKTSTVVGIVLGVLMLLAAQGIVNWDVIGAMIVPVIFVIIGLGFIFRSTGKKNQIPPNVASHFDQADSELTAVFGERKANFRNQQFNGADINAIFGGVTLDLREAVIDHDVLIHATAIFGGADIYVPANVKVKVSSVPVFGGVSNKSMASIEPSAPTVFVNATCMFGGIDIK